MSFLVFVLSFCFVFFLVKYKDKLKIEDIPNQRSMHTIAKPRTGGIAIFLAFSTGIVFSDLSYTKLFLIPAFFVFLLGLYDDIFDVKARVKLLVIFLASGLLFYIGFDFNAIGVYFGHEINLNFWLFLPIFAFCSAGFVNALNLIDGLDGLASVVSIVILGGLFYLGFKHSDIFLMKGTLFLILTIIGFLIFNWYPSKIFMGDSGSLSIGFLIVVFSTYAIKMHYLTPISILLLAGVPIIDTLIVFIRRIKRGQNPFNPDKTHMHHIILKQQHNDVRKTVLVLGLLQVFFTYLGLGFKLRDDSLILFLFILVVTIFYIFLTPKYKKKYNSR
jgi:UDP-GlcNAc:undecaprenyl-phosphate GlcNAc-1-phosphate transferase